MIIGRDLLFELGLIIDFDKKTMSWAECTIPMTGTTTTNERKSLKRKLIELSSVSIKPTEPSSIRSVSDRVKKILDVKYTPANLPEVVNGCAYLDDEQKDLLLKLLCKYSNLFDGTLGTFNVTPVEIELKPNAQPVQLRAFPVPHIRRGMFKQELKRLMDLGVLVRRPSSEWASPSFLIAKSDGQGCFLSDFRKLNALIVRKPYPIPMILDLLQTLEGFTFATTLDLNMGYYTIQLSSRSQDYCTIVTPWGKYAYTRLPMGLSTAPDIFQEKMFTLMEGLEYVRAYLDDLLVLSNSTFYDHLEKLTVVLKKLSDAGLKVHTKKCTFCAPEVEYLGYVITRNGIKPQANKIQAILNLSIPKTVRDVRRILGVVQYYRDMWPRRSHTLVPLTDLISTKEVHGAEKKE